MLHPLASLWRHPARVTFYYSASLAGYSTSVREGLGFSPAMVSRRRFASTDDALHYLRYWLGEPSARSQLRCMLQRSSSSMACGYGATDGWVHALAVRLATGEIVALQDSGPAERPGQLIASVSGATAAAAFATLPLLSDMASTAPVVPAIPMPSSEPVDTAIAVPPEEAPLAASQASTSRDAGPEESDPPLASLAVDGGDGPEQPVPSETLDEAEGEAPHAVLQAVDVHEVGNDDVEVQQADEHKTLLQNAQAETFEQAAVNGTPFCEICARQAAVVANMPAQADTSEPFSPEPPALPAAAQAQAVDQVAQAETLELAAVTVVPFCEICARQAAVVANVLAQAETSSEPFSPEPPALPAAAQAQAVDQVAQAETLELAAVAGVPFCEICTQQAAVVVNEPAQAETSEPFSPEPPALPAAAQARAVDQVAQAETLTLAAVTGVPFCEICEKQRLAF